MTKTVKATFDGEVFRPTEAVALEPNTRVELIVAIKTASDEEPKSFLKVARSLDLSGPLDWSSRFDDSVYGEAKLGEV